MAWFHYLSQWWHKLLTYIWANRPQWVHSLAPEKCDHSFILVTFKHILVYDLYLVFPEKMIHLHSSLVHCIWPLQKFTRTSIITVQSHFDTHFKRHLLISHYQTRTTRTPAFWDTPRRPMITHTCDSHQIPSQNKTKSKLQILKKLPKIKILKFCSQLYMHTPLEVAW